MTKGDLEAVNDASARTHGRMCVSAAAVCGNALWAMHRDVHASSSTIVSNIYILIHVQSMRACTTSVSIFPNIIYEEEEDDGFAPMPLLSRRYAVIKSSMSPSSTACTSPRSRLVRTSLMSLYGCKT